MTAEKLDEADALQGQYGKSESINQSINLSLSPNLRFFARSGPPFVIRSVLIRLGCSGLQMVDLSERENGVWGRERGDRANREYL